MKKIEYYVGTSLDGYISGENEDVSAFVAGGNGIQQYLDDLKSYETVIMGRKTYEFGYKYGLQPGAPAYPHMEHYIFSNSLSFDNPSDQIKIKDIDIDEIEKIRAKSTTDVYLCGGGVFAGWLLENEKIDILKLKVNPMILGSGVKMFGDTKKNYQLALLDTNRYDHDLFINTYEIKY